MNKTLITYSLLIVLVIFGFKADDDQKVKQQRVEVQVLDFKENYSAGEKIELVFKANETIEYQLWLKSSYGNVLLKANNDLLDTLLFTVPSFLSKKKGVIHYNLISNQQAFHSGSLQISASHKKTEPLESYLGPTSINAGGKDYGMLTVLPTDEYDNPLEDSTLIAIEHQFLDIETSEELAVDDFIAWKNIFSYEKSGRILVAAKSKEISSKEFTIDVFPSQAQNFNLDFRREHSYADGNQIMEFFTSTISDKFGNIISDGRVVEFSIETDTKQQLRTTGTTINGIARGYIVHPNAFATWTVQAFIPQMAESNTIALQFDQAVKDYPIEFSSDNRKVKVGPIRSFMNQILPDGAAVTLYIYKDETLLEKIVKSSSQGKVHFKLSEDFFSSDIYTIEVISMGISKKYDRIKLK